MDAHDESNDLQNILPVPDRDAWLDACWQKNKSIVHLFFCSIAFAVLLRIMELSIVFFWKDTLLPGRMSGRCSYLDNFSFTCWNLGDKLSFSPRPLSLLALTKAFSLPLLLVIVLLIVCVCSFAAVAHVHGGLQRSECASSRQSQFLKDRCADCSKGIYKGKQSRGMRVNVIFMTLTLCPGV